MTENNSDSQNRETLEQETHDVVSSTEENQAELENNSVQDGEQSEKTVPVSALQKERKKRQQLQLELEQARSQNTKPAEEDYSKYESVTKEDLGKNNFVLKREVREEDWSNNFPDRASYLEDNLEDFLKQRPNLAFAIQNSGNRLQEAWELMEALNKKAKPQTKKVDREAPQSPGNIPKSAALNNAVDVMNMSDSDFRSWRKSQLKRR